MLFFSRAILSLLLFCSFLFVPYGETRSESVISEDKERVNCHVKWEMSNLSAEPMISGRDWRVEYVKGDSLRISSIQPGQTWGHSGMTGMGPLPPGKYDIYIDGWCGGFSVTLKDIEVFGSGEEDPGEDSEDGDTGETEEDEPEAGELDNQAIKDILVNYFMSAEEVTRTGNLSHLERYAAKEALKIEGRIAQRKIEYLKQVGTTCVTFWFKVHGLQKMFDYDRVGQDAFQVKFYLDRDITYRKKNGKERVSQLRQASHAAILERLTDSQGRKVWKVTEMLFWEGPLTEQELPAITTEELKKNDKTIVYPTWKYDTENPDTKKSLKKHIDKHWGRGPENYDKRFRHHGSDCTNWASQILIKGGRPQYLLDKSSEPDSTQLANWYYDYRPLIKDVPSTGKPDYPFESLTFTQANSLYQHLKQYEKSCTCSEDEKTALKMSTGDLIFVDFRAPLGQVGHAYVVYDNLGGII